MAYIFDGRIQVNKIGATGTTALYGYTRNSGTKWHGGMDVTCPDASEDNTSIKGELACPDTEFDVVQSRIVNNGIGAGTAEWGNYVMLRGVTTGLYFIFAHLASRDVQQGQRIMSGTRIGVMGNTGNARFGYKHVHFEVRESPNGKGINPAPYLGIQNEVGIYGEDVEDDMTRFKIFTPTGKVVSSKQVTEGVVGVMGKDGQLYGYVTSGDSRMAREYTTDTASPVFEAMKAEMQENELIMSVNE